MTEPLPKYDAPPVVETVLSAQFSPLQGFTTAHAGWFWKNHLGQTWTSVQEVPTIQDVFERFGDEKQWGPDAAIRLFTEPESNRLQIIRNDNERMIQVQPSRFIYNWKKSGDKDYPSYEILLPEFIDYYGEFNKFTEEAGYSTPEPNQWEVTYVNHIPKGALWESPSDWARAIPMLSVFNECIEGTQFDGFSGNWSMAIEDNKGRLHVNLKHARIGSAKGPEVLSLQLTARGPADAKRGFDLFDGFDVGHRAIVQTFSSITSKEAHAYWGRQS